MFNIFRKKEPPYDESSDCFLAMQFWLKKYEEEYSWLDKHRQEMFRLELEQE